MGGGGANSQRASLAADGLILTHVTKSFFVVAPIAIKKNDVSVQKKKKRGGAKEVCHLF